MRHRGHQRKTRLDDGSTICRFGQYKKAQIWSKREKKIKGVGVGKRLAQFYLENIH